MKILYFVADPAEVINARLSLLGAGIIDESCFSEVVTSPWELLNEVDRGTLVGKDEVLEYIYASNGMQWDEVARELHYLDCGNKS